MGLNFVMACSAHRVYSYSQRGEEAVDIQWWMRAHGDCFRQGWVKCYRDADGYPGMNYDRDQTDYRPAWNHEERPYVTGVTAALARFAP